MKIREMIEKYRANCTVEIRCNNFKVMEFHSEDYGMVKDELLDKEVSNWFMINENSLIRTRDRIVLDYKEGGAEYIMDDCDGECDSCNCVNCDEHPEYRRKLRAIRLQENIRRLEFE